MAIKWLSVPEFAKLVGKTDSQIYLDVRLGKIKKWKKVKKVTEVIRIAVDN